MVENYYEKSLVKVDNSIFAKIKLFFRNLFIKNKQEEKIVVQNFTEEKNNQNYKDNFVNNMRISKEKVNLRLQKMSKDLESGKIIEEDLCEQELQELRNFYLDRIKEKKQSIDNYKNKIIRVKAQLT